MAKAKPNAGKSGRKPLHGVAMESIPVSILPQAKQDAEQVADWLGVSRSNVICAALEMYLSRHRCSRCHQVAQHRQQLGDGSRNHYCPACWGLGADVLSGWEAEQP